MAIKFLCSHCEATLNVRDELAGRKGACPKCKKSIVVPKKSQTQSNKRVSPSKPVAPKEAPIECELVEAEALPVARPAKAAPTRTTPSQATPPAPANRHQPKEASSTAKEFAKLTPEQIRVVRNKVVRSIKGKHVPTLVKGDEYRNGILMLYAAMISVPLILLGVFASVVLVTFVINPCIGAFFFIIGCVFALMMVLPALPIFLNRKQGLGTSRRLTPQNEPFFYQFVGYLCQMLNAPPPEQIKVDCDVNASASMGDHGLILTIGLPLAAGLNMNQFVGVLSHEIGHFTQAEGMKSLNAFNRFREWAGSIFHANPGFEPVRYIRGGAIFGILWGLSLHLIGFLLRGVMIFVGRLCQRMEFDADRYESLMVGTNVFESTCYSLQYLGVGWQRSIKSLRAFARQKKLGDNLPRLIALNSRQLPGDIVEEIRAKIQSDEKAGLTDSHPSDAERIARVYEEQERGIFNVDAPATALFNTFDLHCKNVTLDVYRRALGAVATQQQMHSMEELLGEREAAIEKAKAADDWFAGIFHPLRPIRNTEVFLNEECDAAARKQDLLQAREQLQQIQPSYFAARQQFDATDGEMVDAEQGIAALTCSLYFTDDYNGVNARRDQAIRARQVAQKKIKTIKAEMVAAEELQGSRIMAALDLMASHAANIGDNDKKSDTANDVLFGKHAIRECLDHTFNLRNLLIAQKSALKHLRSGEVPQELGNLVFQTNERMFDLLERIREHLDSATYPLTEGSDVSIGGLLGIHRFTSRPTGEFVDPFTLCEEVEDFLDDFHNVYRDLTSHLADLVVQVETALKLAPLPVPKNPITQQQT